VAVKIKLKRLGKIRAPYYRIVIADSRTKRDGRAIEEIGKYHPKAEPSLIEVDSERAQHWLSVGAQPTDPVRKILEITGDWQKFKGLPGAEGTLKTAEPRPDRKSAFAAAVAESLTESGTKTKPKGKAAEAKPAEAKTGDKAAPRGKRAPESARTTAEPAAPESAEAAAPAAIETAEPAAPESAEAAAPAAIETAQPAAALPAEASPAAIEAMDDEAKELAQEVETGIAEADSGTADAAEGAGEADGES